MSSPGASGNDGRQTAVRSPVRNADSFLSGWTRLIYKGHGVVRSPCGLRISEWKCAERCAEHQQ